MLALPVLIIISELLREFVVHPVSVKQRSKYYSRFCIALTTDGADPNWHDAKKGRGVRRVGKSQGSSSLLVLFLPQQLSPRESSLAVVTSNTLAPPARVFLCVELPAHTDCLRFSPSNTQGSTSVV